MPGQGSWKFPGPSAFPVAPHPQYPLLFCITLKIYPSLPSTQTPPAPLPASKADLEPDSIYAVTQSFNVWVCSVPGPGLGTQHIPCSWSASSQVGDTGRSAGPSQYTGCRSLTEGAENSMLLQITEEVPGSGVSELREGAIRYVEE